jgi:hypothetical protein
MNDIGQNLHGHDRENNAGSQMLEMTQTARPYPVEGPDQRSDHGGKNGKTRVTKQCLHHGTKADKNLQESCGKGRRGHDEAIEKRGNT